MKKSTQTSPLTALFAAVLSLTLASGGTALHLAGQPDLTDAQERLFNRAIAMWTMGTTTLVGLLNVGKTEHPDE